MLLPLQEVSVPGEAVGAVTHATLFSANVITLQILKMNCEVFANSTFS